MGNEHTPFVSEHNEGQPWFEWTVAGLVTAATALAFFGYMMAATVVLSVTAMATGVTRLILRERSPWKIRSVPVDALLGIMLGIGLIVTYLSIRFLS